MAWAEQLPNGLYRGGWRDGSGRRHSKSGFKQKALALRFAGEQEAKSRRGEATVETGKSPTWRHWSTEWLKLRRVEPSTRREDKIRIGKHLDPYWGSWRIGKITREDVQEWVNLLDEQMAPGTVRRVYYTFSASMKAALLARKIHANPCTAIDLPVPAEATERFYTRAEFDLVVHYLDEPWRTAAIVLVGTGLRFNELAGLHWARVDFETETLTVAETYDDDLNEIKPYPKSQKPRPVPMPRFVVAALTEYLDGMGQELPPNCGLVHRGTRRACRSALVLTADGKPLDAHLMLRRHWNPALKKARLEPGTVHDLRHTYASWLRQAGVDLQVVQRLLGHASITTTSRYSHFGPDTHKAVRDVLDA